MYIFYDAQHVKKALISYGKTEDPDHNAPLQSDLSILCSSTYTTVAIDSVSGQQVPISACVNKQADLGLLCPLIS